MISYVQAITIGLTQGITELFPISSLGHTVLLPSLVHWHIDQSSDQFVAFVVLTHLATALVLLAFFWKDWLALATGIVRSLGKREISEQDTYAKLGWLLIVSTIPAGMLGLLSEEKLQSLFSSPRIVAGALILNGLVLYGAEILRKKAAGGFASDRALAKLSWSQGIGIGFLQCLALIPGFSRTGLTMTGGLVNGLSHENAVRYSFLLATPIIFAAAVLKIPDLFFDTRNLLPALAGAGCAALAAYFSTRFLVEYFKTKTLRPFALYCVGLGILSLILLAH